LGTIAYGSMALIDSPLNYSNLPFFILVSCSAIGTVIATSSLIGQEAPAKQRGSIIGISTLFGAIGILTATALGGRLFDQLGPSGPFLFICGMHSVLLLATIIVRIRAPGMLFQSKLQPDEVHIND
jgi:MFS family permease